jgi:TPR repeat protein
MRYAPKRMRETHEHSTKAVRRLSQAAQFGAEYDAAREPVYPPSAPRDLDEDPRPVRAAPRRTPEFEGDVAIRQMRDARTFRSEEYTEPRWREQNGLRLGMLLRFGAAIAVATFGALVYVGAVPIPAAVAGMIASLGQSAESGVGPATTPEASVATAVRGSDVALANPAPQAVPAQTDATGGTTPAVKTVATTPWPQNAPSPAAAPVEEPAVPATMRRLDPEEIDALIRRGETFILQGDFAAARLMLQRAAEAGNGRAAVMLGATYDPVVLRRVGVVGLKAEPERAREWYERAVALGSPDASARMAELGRD